MEPTEQEAPAQEAEAQEAHAAHAAPHTTPHAAPEAPEPKRRGRPPGSKNKPKQDVPTEPAAPKRKPKPVETTPVEAPPAEAPAEPEAPQLTREQQRALRMLERQLLGILQAYLGVIILQPHACTQRFRLRILRRTRSNAGRTSARSLSGRI